MNNLIVSPHKLEISEICTRLYNFRFNLGYSPAITPKYYTEGNFFHLLLEDYYKDIMNRRKQDIPFYLEIARNKAAAFEGGLTLDELDYLIQIFSQYLEFYDTNYTWKITGVETPFAKILWEGKVGSEDYRIILQGKSDLTIEKENIPIIVDHKLRSQNREIISRTNQNLAYLWALGYKDFIVNAIGKQKTYSAEKKFLREYLSYSDYQIAEWYEIAVESSIEIINRVNSSHFPGRYAGCSFQGHKCAFYDVCETSKDNWEYKLNANFILGEDYQSGYFPAE